MTDITQIVVSVLSVLFAVATAFFIPWLKTNMDAVKFERMLTVVKIAVEAAEQMFRESGMGAKKKEYVINYLAERGYKLDTDQLDVLIESAVKEMRMSVEAT